MRIKLGLGVFWNSYIEKINISLNTDKEQKYEYYLRKEHSKEWYEYSMPKNLDFNKAKIF